MPRRLILITGGVLLTRAGWSAPSPSDYGGAHGLRAS